MQQLFISVYDIDTFEKVKDKQISGIILNHSLVAETKLFQQLLTFLSTQQITVYIKDNRLLHNAQLEQFETNLNRLAKYPQIGIFSGDPAVLYLSKKLQLKNEVVYAPEMVVTSSYQAHFWQGQGSTSIELAHELTLKETNKIRSKIDFTPFVQIYGYLSMFQSRRKLVSNYFDHLNETKQVTTIESNQSYKIADHERALKYPVLEDERGTEIFSGQILTMIDRLDKFERDFCFILDTRFFDQKYLESIIDLHVDALLCLEASSTAYDEKRDFYYTQLEHALNGQPLMRGFFYKPTVY